MSQVTGRWVRRPVARSHMAIRPTNSGLDRLQFEQRKYPAGRGLAVGVGRFQSDDPGPQRFPLGGRQLASDSVVLLGSWSANAVSSHATAMARPAQATGRGSSRMISDGTAIPASSRPSGTTWPGPPSRKLSVEIARTRAVLEPMSGRDSVQASSPEVLSAADAATPPASAIVAPGAVTPSWRSPPPR